MITIDEFLSTEGSIEFVINILLETIDKIKTNNIIQESLSFNVYKVLIDKGLDQVVITNDIFACDEEVMRISIDDFYKELNAIKKNNGMEL